MGGKLRSHVLFVLSRRFCCTLYLWCCTKTAVSDLQTTIYALRMYKTHPNQLFCQYQYTQTSLSRARMPTNTVLLSSDLHSHLPKEQLDATIGKSKSSPGKQAAARRAERDDAQIDLL